MLVTEGQFEEAKLEQWKEDSHVKSLGKRAQGELAALTEPAQS